MFTAEERRKYIGGGFVNKVIYGKIYKEVA